MNEAILNAPEAVIEASKTLDKYFKEQGVNEWAFGNVCSRSIHHLCEHLRAENESLKAQNKMDLLYQRLCNVRANLLDESKFESANIISDAMEFIKEHR